MLTGMWMAVWEKSAPAGKEGWLWFSVREEPLLLHCTDSFHLALTYSRQMSASRQSEEEEEEEELVWLQELQQEELLLQQELLRMLLL